MSRWTVLAAAAVLSACNNGPARSGDADAVARAREGEVALAAQAPDGTRLWMVRPAGTPRVVYFSSGGAQAAHSERCGKGCTRIVDDVVPNAEPRP